MSNNNNETYIKRLKRSELIEVIYELQKREIQLEEKVAGLMEALEDRRIVLEEAGSIAEASLKLNHVFEDAQQAADIYLEEVKMIHGSAEEKANETISLAKAEADEIISTAKAQADYLYKSTREECDRLLSENEEAIKVKWESFSKGIEGVLKQKDSPSLDLEEAPGEDGDED